jgi:protein import protein ZIM17
MQPIAARLEYYSPLSRAPPLPLAAAAALRREGARCWFSASGLPSAAATEDGDLQVEPPGGEEEQQQPQQQLGALATGATTPALTPTGPRTARRDMAIAFTCNRCQSRSVKAFSRSAYERGVVVVQCPGCQARHLIADNLGWFPRGGVESGRGGGGGEGGEKGGDADGQEEEGGMAAAAGGGGGEGVGERGQHHRRRPSGGGTSWRVEDLAAEGREDVRRMTLEQACREEMAAAAAEAESAAAAQGGGGGRGGGG